MSVKNLAIKSRSFRRFYEERAVSKKILIKLVELARFCPSMRNQQALKFLISYKSGVNDLIFPSLKWAAALTDWEGPSKGERPSAYIVILGDKKISSDFGPDYGIAAQTMLLAAQEYGLGGCMLGSIDRMRLRKNLKLPEQFDILLVVALGKPKEKVILEDLKAGGSTAYYRDKKGRHHVPKRPLKDLIYEGPC